MLFLCSELCIAWCKTENEKQKAREKSRNWSSDHTHTKKSSRGAARLRLHSMLFPFLPSLSLFFKLLRYFSCWFSATRGSSTRNSASSLIHTDSSRSLLADPARHHRLRLHKRQGRAIPYSCASFQKKKKARSIFKQKRDTNELALKKQFFFVFRKKVTNQLRLQFTLVFIVVTVLLLMMLYFSSSFLFKSLPTSALMLTARCTLIKRLTKKKKKRECARHSRNKNGGKKTKTHTTPAFLLCFFLASRSHSPSLPLTRTHMQETPHTLLDFTLSFFFFLRV